MASTASNRLIMYIFRGNGNTRECEADTKVGMRSGQTTNSLLFYKYALFILKFL